MFYYTTTTDHNIISDTGGDPSALIVIELQTARFLAGYLQAIMDHVLDKGSAVTEPIAQLQYILNTCGPLE